MKSWKTTLCAVIAAAAGGVAAANIDPIITKCAGIVATAAISAGLWAAQDHGAAARGPSGLAPSGPAPVDPKQPN